MIKIDKLSKYLILFIIGGSLYFLIEIMWRQYSYFSMFVLGGLCFISIGLTKEYFSRVSNSLLMQQVLASLVITSLELLFGLVLNIKLGLGIWDYSDVNFNFMGQICLEYTVLWFFLSLPAIFLYDYLSYWLFKGERPQYKYI